MEYPVDLHLHTTASDGSQTPAQLLESIRAAGLQIFSVTDHDTLDGALEMAAIVPEDLRYIMGIEISCITPAGKCHILGYGFDPHHPAIQDILAREIQLRREKVKRRIAFLEARFGIRLTKEESQWLYGLTTPLKLHFGILLRDRGLAPDIGTAITQYMDLCDVGNDRIDADFAIRGILQAGGIPVWAHPLGGENEPHLTQTAFDAQLVCLKAAGIQAMECYYSRYSQADIGYLLEKARSHSLLISGGSDYHGNNKPDLFPGKLNTEEMPVSPDSLTILQVCK